MSDFRGVTVVKGVGYQVPDEYLKSVIKNFPSTYGMVGINKGSMDIEVIRDAADLKTQRELNKATEKSLIVFYFGKHPEGFLDDTMQPFRLLVSEDGKTGLLACTMVGDFQQHLPNGSKQSPQFWAANNVLLPEVQQIHRLCKGDLKLFGEELASDIMKKKINSMIGPQGGQITLFLTGDPPTVMHYQKSLPTFKKFTWGDTSDVLDYVTGIETSATPVKAKKSKFLDALVEDEPEVKQPDKVEEPAKLPITVPQIPPKLNTADKKITLSDGSTVVRRLVNGVAEYWWTPPSNITKMSKLRGLYKIETGMVLTNNIIAKHPEVKVKEGSRYGHLFNDVLGELLHNRNSNVSGETALPAKEAPKEGPIGATGPEEIVKGGNGPAGPPADTGTEIYSIVNKKSIYDINKYLKTLDKAGQSVINPELWQSMEDTSKFIKDINYPGIEQTFGWSDEVRYNLAKIDPKAMVAWTNGLLTVIHNLNKEIEGLTDSDVMEDKDVLPVFKKKTAA